MNWADILTLGNGVAVCFAALPWAFVKISPLQAKLHISGRLEQIAFDWIYAICAVTLAAWGYESGELNEWGWAWLAVCLSGALAWRSSRLFVLRANARILLTQEYEELCKNSIKESPDLQSDGISEAHKRTFYRSLKINGIPNRDMEYFYNKQRNNSLASSAPTSNAAGAISVATWQCQKDRPPE